MSLRYKKVPFLSVKDLQVLQDRNSKHPELRDPSEVFCIQCERYTIHHVCECTNYHRLVHA